MGEVIPCEWTPITALEVAGAFENILHARPAALALLMYWALTVGRTDVCANFNIFDQRAAESDEVFSCRYVNVVAEEVELEKWRSEPNRHVGWLCSIPGTTKCVVSCQPPDTLTQFRVFASVYAGAVAFVEHVRSSASPYVVSLIESGDIERLCNQLSINGLFDPSRVDYIAACEAVLAEYSQTVGDPLMARKAAALLHLVNLHSKQTSSMNHGEV